MQSLSGSVLRVRRLAVLACALVGITAWPVRPAVASDLSGRLSGVAERRAEPPIIFLNGERITEAQMKALDKETIKSVEVLKGPKAVEKYGPDAVNGVILITLK